MPNQFPRRSDGGPGPGHDPNEVMYYPGTNRPIPKEPPAKDVPPSGVSHDDRNSPREKAAKARREWVRDLLQGAASSAEVGNPMHPEDRQMVLAQVDADAATAPPRVRAALKAEVAGLLDRIGSGDALGAHERVREAAFEIGGQLPSMFSPPTEDPAELARQAVER